ncbi:hypothetical protein P153DRAFT_147502 [Dothidotthia symphoricarpi CBS 119687]|uniref:Uncharacterized protein n=1 Tax=Dothidotthia symphoricarpi CBS 119687 TaxID=1392245 RepID=A0A6A5ZXD1_9PLEO|nr:uncharacterized protein P153DRAFT_147502 [Dothidotthia symphoricarpi CBS 119687]KAF2123685.1 hypothetical protein P153DRAFT_147502 [Dothidotthia symphoricarpi CBS 119687]
MCSSLAAAVTRPLTYSRWLTGCKSRSTLQADDVFSPSPTQLTKSTQAAHSSEHSIHDDDESDEKDKRHDTGDSFILTNEGHAKKHQDDVMDVRNCKANTSCPNTEGTVVHHEVRSGNNLGDNEDKTNDWRRIVLTSTLHGYGRKHGIFASRLRHRGRKASSHG